MTTHRTILGGRLRVSTAAVLGSFVAVLALYLSVRPAELVAERTGQLVRLSEAREIVKQERAQEQAAARVRRTAEEPSPTPTPERTPERTAAPRPTPAPAAPAPSGRAPATATGKADAERSGLLDLLNPSTEPSTPPQGPDDSPPTPDTPEPRSP